MLFKQNNFELIKYLVTLDKIDINVKEGNPPISIQIYVTILYKACEAGNLDLVKYLISSNKVYINNRNILMFNFLIIFQKR